MKYKIISELAMNKIRANLQGGLGNQCFIYAAARAAALRNIAKVSCNLDYLVQDYVYRRKLALNNFACSFESEMSCNWFVRKLSALRLTHLRKWLSRAGSYCIETRPCCFRPLPSKWRGTLTIDGYWQSEKYFYDAREQLLQDFRLKDSTWIACDPVARQIQDSENSVFLHLRSYKEVPGKGDGQCARAMVEYYSKAIAYVAEHVENPVFFVFSDDIAFARELIGRDDFTYVTPNESVNVSGQIRDFTLMRMCKHGIVADSSFSWWAGWLGEQERLHKGEKPIRLRVNRRVMNDDFWPERWVAI